MFPVKKSQSGFLAPSVRFVCVYSFVLLIVEQTSSPLLEPQSRFGDKLLEISVNCPQNGDSSPKRVNPFRTAVLFGDQTT